MENRTLFSAQLVRELVAGTGGLRYASQPVLLGDRVFFVAEATGNWILYASDGTGRGTLGVKQLSAFTSTAESPYTAPPTNSKPAVIDGANLYFVATNGHGARALWRTDGTSPGTRMVTDPGIVADVGDAFGLVDHTVYFTARSKKGEVHTPELWRTDGKSTGNMVKNFSATGDVNLHSLSAFKHNLYFILYSRDQNHSLNSTQLWRSDGTSSETRSLEATGSNIRVVRDRIYVEDDQKLWESDGSEAGTHVAVDVTNLVKFLSFKGVTILGFIGRKMYLFALSGTVLESDGTTKGTKVVIPRVVFIPGGTMLVRDRIVYADLFDEDSRNYQPYVYDPKTGRSKVLKIMSPPPGLFTIDVGPQVGSNLFIRVNRGGTGVWITDGTSLGTAQVDSHTVDYNGIVKLGSRYLFLADDAQHGGELWRLPSVGNISGSVFRDDDGSGKRSAGEPGLKGFRVFLDANNDGKFTSTEISTRTDANGKYSFSDVPVGKYVVRQTPVDGYRLTTSSSYSVFVPPGGDVSRSFGDHLSVKATAQSLPTLFDDNDEHPGEFSDAATNGLV